MSNFVTKTRPDGTPFIALSDEHNRRMEGSPVFRAVRAAHEAFDGILPNDFIYSVCEAFDEHGVDLTDDEAADEAVHVVADGIAERYVCRVEYHRWAAANPLLECWGEDLWRDEVGEHAPARGTVVYMVARHALRAYAAVLADDAGLVNTIGSRFVSAG